MFDRFDFLQGRKRDEIFHVNISDQASFQARKDGVLARHSTKAAPNSLLYVSKANEVGV